MPEPAPYQRIAAELRRRIADGELRPGARVPSTRAIVREYGVAMATAAKALSLLVHDGLAHAVPGSGTIVSDPVKSPRVSSRAPARVVPPRKADPDPALDRERLIEAAIALADKHGRDAVSMRRLAAELGVGPMALYRHVPDKEELLRLMADTAFGSEPLPEPPPRGWRARLEAGVRVQWRAYRRHPWLAPILLNSLVRPPVLESALRQVEWGLAALRGAGLEARTMVQVVMILNGYVGGLAATNAYEVETERATGLTGGQRLDAEVRVLLELLGTGRFPVIADLMTGMADFDIDEIFEFGLERQLDAVAVLLAKSAKLGS